MPSKMIALFVCLVSLLSISASDASSNIYEPKKLPGKMAIWTHDKDFKFGQTADYNTQTLDIPSVVSYLEQNHADSEVLVVLKSADQSKSPLTHESVKESIRSTPFALVMPSIYRSADAASVTTEEHMKKSSLCQGAKSMSLESLHAELSAADSNANPIRNNRLDTYFATLRGDESDAVYLKEISQLSGENGRAVTFIAASEPSVDAFAPTEDADYSRILASTSTSTTDPTSLYYSPEGGEYSIYYGATYLYITPDIFTGLMTFLFMFFVLLTGFSCLSSIQGPYSFASRNPPVGREA